MAFEGRVFGGAFSIPVDPSLVNAGKTLNNTLALIPALDFVPWNDNATDLGKANQRWKNLYATTVTGTSGLLTTLEVTNVKGRTASNTLFNMIRRFVDGSYGEVTEITNGGGVNYLQVTETSGNRMTGNLNLTGTLNVLGTSNSINFPTYQIVQTSGGTGLDIGTASATNLIHLSTANTYGQGAGTITLTANGGTWLNVLYATQVFIGSLTYAWHLNEIAGTLYCTDVNGIGVRIASGATAWAANSDIRTKRDISYLPKNSNTLSRMLKVRTCHFNYLKDPDNTPERIGVIAQELEELFPDVVDTDKNEEGLKSVRYASLIPYLVKSIQELSAKVETLTKEVESLKDKEEKRVVYEALHAVRPR
jgi:hypothetical protein